MSKLLALEGCRAHPVGREKSGRRIKSIEVGFRIIRALEAAERFLPLVRLSALVGMPSSKIHVYLASFLREGVVIQDPVTGQYGLGPFSVQLGLAAIRTLDVVGAGRDVVDGLRDSTGCGVSLAIWGNRGPTLVLKSDGEGQGSFAMRLGHVFHPSTSAAGRVFLAYLPERDTAEALRAEEALGGALDPVALDRVREETRARGYGVSERPTVTGRIALAAPVFDYGDKPVAALAVLAPDDQSKGDVLSSLLASGGEISRRLGARAPHAVVAATN